MFGFRFSSVLCRGTSLKNCSKVRVQNYSTSIKHTTTENGVEVFTLDVGGTVINPRIGIRVNAGSRYEKPHTSGISQFVEQLAYLGKAKSGCSTHLRAFWKVGAEFQASRDREHLLYSSTLNQTSPIPRVSSLLYNVLFNPETYHYHLEDVIPSVESRLKDVSTFQEIEDLVHQEAFRNQPLSRQLYPKWNSQAVNFDHVEEFRREMTTSSISVLGVGVEHKFLESITSKLFESTSKFQKTELKQSQFIPNGEVRKFSGPLPTPTTVAVVFPGEKINGEDSFALNVLAKLAGSAGKGPEFSANVQTLSSHFSQIIQSHHWLTAVRTVHHQYSDSGLFSIYASTVPSPQSTSDPLPASENVNRLPQFLVNELKEVLRNADKSKVQLAAKALQVETLSALESPYDAFDYLYKQSCSGGKILTPEEYSDALSNVTVKDIQRVASKLFSVAPVVVAHGDVAGLIRL